MTYKICPNGLIMDYIENYTFRKGLLHALRDTVHIRVCSL